MLVKIINSHICQVILQNNMELIVITTLAQPEILMDTKHKITKIFTFFNLLKHKIEMSWGGGAQPLCLTEPLNSTIANGQEFTCMWIIMIRTVTQNSLSLRMMHLAEFPWQTFISKSCCPCVYNIMFILLSLVSTVLQSN